jgi:fructose-1,6-bisphosphatase/inositol monophosphatase family enzyme
VTTGGLDDLRHAVGAALREAATRVVMPRFRALKAGEVSAKGPDDLVTVADVEAEALISARLRELRPGVPVLGEEASHDDQGLRDRVEREGAYWVVDPLDGTKNFVAGEASFGLMVGLVENGSTVAGWIYLPATDVLYDGCAGGHVRRNGEPVTRPVTPATLTGFALTRLAPPEVRTVVEDGIASFVPPADEGVGCAATAYAHLLEGRVNFGFCWRTAPWDHAPGTFLVSLSGGRSARLDGADYRPGDDRTGLIVTGRAVDWVGVRDTLCPLGGLA